MYGFVDTVPGSGTGSTSLMSIRTIFNGKDLDQELTDETGSFTTLTVNGRNDTSSAINSFFVPSMDGAHEEGNTIDPKTINVRFRIKDKTNEGFRKRLNRLNALLSGSKIVLEFTDEDAIFYATVSSVSLPDEDSNDLIGNIYFYCSDPYKYGPEEEVNFTSDIYTVTNKGTAPAKPIIELDVIEPTTFAYVSNGDEYLMMGRDVSDDEIAIEPKTSILNDPMNSLVGWTNGTYVDNGVISGTMATDSDGFYASDFGTGTGWHGPARKRSLSEPLQDFESQIHVENLNLSGGMGMIEVYFMDVNENTVAKLGIEDAWQSLARMQVKMQLGNPSNRHSIYGEPQRASHWYDYRGIMRIARRGNVWSAYFAVVENGVYRYPYQMTFSDSENKYQNQIAQIQVAIRKRPSAEATRMRVNHIYVSRLNDLSANNVPYIALPGDKIEMDFVTKALRINGELRKDLISMGSRFFDLQSGINNVGILPENTFNTKIRYREPYK